jgi:hypothetical protein
MMTLLPEFGFYLTLQKLPLHQYSWFEKTDPAYYSSFNFLVCHATGSLSGFDQRRDL